jgi:N-acetylneuraminate synthase
MKKQVQVKYHKPKVIAEIGCNHMGDIKIAKELIKLAKEAGCDVAKFQKRNNTTLLDEAAYKAPHPNPANAFGDSYGAHREYLEFTVEQHNELMQYCKRIKITYSTSTWDVVSAHEIISLQPEFIKVPSACNNNFEMLKVLRDDYKGDVHISFGMTTHAEEEAVVKFFEETDSAMSRLIVYSCTSGYPVPFEDVCLLEITRIRECFAHRVKSIGFSGHHNGIAVDIAAYVLGAEWIERHFTKDRTWKGTDHAASLEYPGMYKLCRDLKNGIYPALKFKKEEILDIEKVQRKKLKYSA